MARARKLVKKKKAFVINFDTLDQMESIEPGIKEAIKYDSDSRQFLLDSVEMGHFGNIAQMGDVVAYEVVSDCKECPTGYNLWCMGNVDKAAQRVTIVSETEIFTKPTSDDIIFFSDVKESIEFINEHSSEGYFEKNVIIDEKGNITIHTKYGDAKGKIGNCYIICHKPDSLQLITLGTPSLDDYYIFEPYNMSVQKANEYKKIVANTKIKFNQKNWTHTTNTTYDNEKKYKNLKYTKSDNLI